MARKPVNVTKPSNNGKSTPTADPQSRFAALDLATRSVGKMTSSSDAKVAIEIADEFLVWLNDG